MTRPSDARTPGFRTRSSPPSSRDLLELIEAVSRELSLLLDSGDIPRARRPEARRRMMEAWIAVHSRGSGRGRRDRTIESLRMLLRELDRLVLPAGGDPAGPRRMIHVSDRPTLIGLRGNEEVSDRGAAARIRALQRSTAAIVRRTEFMIEHALKTLERGRTAHPKVGSPSIREGREELELVWGETEG